MADITVSADIDTFMASANKTAARTALALGNVATLNVGTTAGTAAAGDDSRFTDSRTPTAHATSHKSGGSDAIKLDELAAPTDVTTLNVSTTAHGLAPKLPNDAAKFLNGIGTYTTPSGGGGGTATWELLATSVISSPASSVDITGLTGHRKYMVEFDNFLCAGDGYPLTLVMSTDNGATWNTGGSDYNWSMSSTNYLPGQGTGAFCTLPTVGSGADEGLTGDLVFFDPNNAAINSWYEGTLVCSAYNSVTVDGWDCLGRRNANSAVNALRLVFASGQNVGGGTIRIFGWNE